MKPDDFEQRLARVPWRTPPETWREEILEAARSAGPTRRAGTASGWGGIVEGCARWVGRVRGAWVPWGVLAGAWALALLLHGLEAGGLGEAGAPGEGPSAADLRPGAGLVEAARAYRAQVLILVNHEEGTSDLDLPAIPEAPRPAPGPRTQRLRVPGDGIGHGSAHGAGWGDFGGVALVVRGVAPEGGGGNAVGTAEVEVSG